MRSTDRRTILFAAAIAASLLGSLSVTTARADAALGFNTPVRLPTYVQCGGYEPSLVVDTYGNVVVTAHKQNHCLAAGPDPAGAVPVRTQSWLWNSTDDVNFTDMPGLTALGADRLDFGDEGDLARDDSGGLYFVDTKVADNSFTSWKATGLGAITETAQTPAMGTAQPVDDRPWITAHGNGVVAYFGNEGDKKSYPASAQAPGSGPGRYTVNMSADGGATFDHVGYQLPDSGWCRPAADHAPGSHLLYAVCTNDGGADDTTTFACSPGFKVGQLYSYVSADDGKSWTRHDIRPYNACNPVDSWPSTTVAANGDVYALYLDSPDAAGSPGPTGSLPGAGDPLASITASSYRLRLFRSTDHGVTWAERDVTPDPTGKYHYAWMDVAADGTIGVVYYHSVNASSDWFVEAETASGWSAPFSTARISPQRVSDSALGPLGDFFECAFGPDNRLRVVWTSLTTMVGQDFSYGLNSDIFYAVQSPAAPAASVPEASAGAAALAGAGGVAALAALLMRRRRRDEVGTG